MKNRIVVAFLLLLALSTTAAAEMAETRSEEGLFLITVQTEPSRPLVGNNLITLTIVDGRSKAPVEGAILEVVPWMTIHGHGSTKKARIKEKGKGVYLVEDVYFTMVGDWDLLIKIRKDKAEDRAIITFSNVRT